MNIRKLIYYPTERQRSQIVSDINHITGNCERISSDEWKEQLESEKSHNGCCPNCQARRDNIVNKIKDVNGQSKSHTSMRFGFGYLINEFNISTNEVNYCNVCGNEWKKFKLTHVSQTKVLRVALKYLGEIIANPNIKEKHHWKAETIEIFDGCCAESIWVLSNKHRIYLGDDINQNLKLSVLRKYYKSVFNK